MPPISDAVILRLLDEVSAELTNEENKCARVLAALAVSSGALVTGVLASGWSPFGLSVAGAMVWWLGASAVLAAVLLAGVAVVYSGEPDSALLAEPRPAGSDALPLQQWAFALAASPAQAPVTRLWRARHTVGFKRRLLKASLAFMGAGIVVCVVSALPAALPHTAA
ncbi:hypothetical protein GCM10022251_75130 [Phytohabitans flavus]|uniref:Pycsar effector protein domain-containing protein n=1 Tax=Phytohabitans flavus TaxID=1076124 RepID=A0A6F8XLG5_9ACTN|nr:hypothetical protein Pflav_010390 [Phytohabitans flavus]